MALILFRDLPGIAEIERSLQLLEENKLMKPEIDELEARLDEKSIELLGISSQQTSYRDAKPDVRAAMTHEEFEELFAFLEWEWGWDEEPAYWAAFGLDVRNEHGDRLASIDYFGRQIVRRPRASPERIPHIRGDTAHRPADMCGGGGLGQKAHAQKLRP